METPGLDKSVQDEHLGKTTEDTPTPVNETPAPECASSTAEEAAECLAGESVPENAPDFSDEEADLAGSADEYNLGDETEEEKKENSPEENSKEKETYAGKLKKEIVDLFAAAISSKPVMGLRKEAEAAKIAFYKAHKTDLERQRKEFVAAGGDPDQFVPEQDNLETRLKELFGLYRSKRDELLGELEKSKEDNYLRKLQIIDELKELVNSNETINQTFNAFRDLQQKWKETGNVAQDKVKHIWEMYHHHVENFYSYIKINQELRDLDLKKNYEAKLELCEEAEALMLEESVVTAFHKLQKLHERWREIGPVAIEYKESLWERFKEASSNINKRHQEHFETVKQELQRNLELKTELCVKAEEVAGGNYLGHKEWNKASEELEEIQKVWKTIGFAPKKDNTRIYERFRNACNQFFEAKREFYVGLKREMDENLKAKTEICETAESMSNSEEWKKTTNDLIDLQKKWKEIGPVSRKYSDAIWKRFRAACEAFFARKSQHYSGMGSQQEDNLARKKAIIEQLHGFTFDSVDEGFEALKKIQRQWSETGFVPIAEKEAIQKEYRKAVDECFARLRSSDSDKKIRRFKEHVANISEKGDRQLRNERDRLYNRMRQLESDIALWENNIGFFAKSKNAEKLVEDVNSKIARARQEIELTIEKIKTIDATGNE